MNFKPRYIGLIPKPDQFTLACLTGETELRVNQECQLWHFGEDGPGPAVVTLREFFIERQQDDISQFQEWYQLELMDQWYSDDSQGCECGSSHCFT